MLRTDLEELIRNGSSSGIAFQSASAEPEQLSTDIAALANFQGGHVLLGVQDDGTVSGLVRDVGESEAWVKTICRQSVGPAITPSWETIRWSADSSRHVGVITIPSNAFGKPYRTNHRGQWITMIRAGSLSRETTPDEEQRLFAAAVTHRYELRVVPGATFDDLDSERLRHYFSEVRGQEAPPSDDTEAWERLLVHVMLMRRDAHRATPTVAGLLLFGRSPRRWLPQAGVRAVAYQTPGTGAARERTLLNGPIVPLLRGEITSSAGLIDAALDFARRHLGMERESAGRGDESSSSIPLEVIREALVNAVTHRDYSQATMEVALDVFPDRAEVISPGRLPNGISIASLKAGCRSTRNEVIKDTLRDYGVMGRGLGIPRGLIARMRKFNGTEPELIEEENRFVVRLHRGAAASPGSDRSLEETENR